MHEAKIKSWIAIPVARYMAWFEVDFLWAYSRKVLRITYKIIEHSDTGYQSKQSTTNLQHTDENVKFYQN